MTQIFILIHLRQEVLGEGGPVAGRVWGGLEGPPHILQPGGVASTSNWDFSKFFRSLSSVLKNSGHTAVSAIALVRSAVGLGDTVIVTAVMEMVLSEGLSLCRWQCLWSNFLRPSGPFG